LPIRRHRRPELKSASHSSARTVSKGRKPHRGANSLFRGRPEREAAAEQIRDDAACRFAPETGTLVRHPRSPHLSLSPYQESAQRCCSRRSSDCPCPRHERIAARPRREQTHGIRQWQLISQPRQIQRADLGPNEISSKQATDDELLTVAETAQRLQVDRHTVYRFIREGRLSATKVRTLRWCSD
jgi:excisionase family DNA binding protein